MTDPDPIVFVVDDDASGSPAWSPNGKIIACPGADKIGAYYGTIFGIAEDGSQRALTSKKWFDVGRIVWLPDGSGWC